MQNFLRIVRLTLSRRFTFAAAIACSLGVAFLWGANLSLIKPIIEIVFSPLQPHEWADSKVREARLRLETTQGEWTLAVEQNNSSRVGLEQKLALEQKALAAAEFVSSLVYSLLPNNKFHAMALFLGLLVAATFVKDALLVGNLLLVERLTQLATLDVRNQLFRRTLDMELSYLGDGHSSQLMQRINSEVTCAFNGINVLFGRMILEPLKMVACLVGAALICWRLLVISILVAPLIAWVLSRIMQSLRRANKRAMDEMGTLATLLSETLTNMQTVKAFGMERYERHRYHQSGKQFFHRAMRIIFYNALGRASAEFMGMAMICMAIGVGAYLVIHQRTTLLGIPIMNEPLSLGSVMAFYALLAGMTDPGRKISEVTGTLQRGIAAADRLFEILDYKPTIVDPDEPQTLTSAEPELIFERVSVQYSTGERVLNKIDLRIPFGQTVAIVGPNGCGKTTLVNLLPRFYDPLEGAIRLDGIDIRELRLKDLRKLIGLVAQQATLFDDTVLNNIRYGSPHATTEEAVEAAEKAFAHKFIVERLEQGYETLVGERGCRLSGGQKQRILLARAILRNPKFLILDEATSQIDVESEQLIHQVLEQFVRDRTTLLITHRMSSLALADRIVVMESGRIVDSGNHEELLRRCDFYRRQYQVGMQDAA